MESILWIFVIILLVIRVAFLKSEIKEIRNDLERERNYVRAMRESKHIAENITLKYSRIVLEQNKGIHRLSEKVKRLKKELHNAKTTT